MVKSTLVLILISTLVGCASLDSVSTSSIPKNRSMKVSAKSEKFIFLGFNFSNDYVDQIVKDLAQQCPNGKVEGLLTKQENINYFLYFFWTSKVTASGYCVNSTVASSKTDKRTPSSNDESEN